MDEAPERFEILTVDDQPENLILLDKTLSSAALKVLKAHSGDEALGLLKEGHVFSMAILDIQMPGMDGFELAARMRASDEGRHLPIIFLTATSRLERNIFKGYESGAVDYMFKPVEPEIIRCKAAIFLDLHKQRLLIERQAGQLAAKVKELEDAMEQIKVLRGIIPICVHCKKIRDDKGYWEQVERYIRKHSEADFTHGICPDCLRKHFPDLAEDILDGK